MQIAQGLMRQINADDTFVRRS